MDTPCFVILLVSAVLAVLLLKWFDQIAGRGPKQVKDGIVQAGLGLPRDQPQHLSTADELAKLAKLRDTGVLTTAEFESAKKKLLSIDTSSEGQRNE